MWTKFRTSISWRIAGILISLCSLLISVSSYLVYQTTHSTALQSSKQTVQEFINTVSKTAAIAAYLDDKVLAKEVVNGLLNSELIRAAELNSEKYKIFSGGVLELDQQDSQYHYPLFSPFDEREFIGELVVQADRKALQNSAQKAAFGYVSFMVSCTLISILLVVVLVNQLLIRPIHLVCDSLHSIEPGTEQRLSLPNGDRDDEISVLSGDINGLLNSVEQQLLNERELRSEIELLEHRFRNIFEQTSGGIAIIDEDGLLQMNNPAFENLVGPQVMADVLRDENRSIYPLLQFSSMSRQEIGRQLRNHAPLSFDIKITRTNEIAWLNCFISKLPGERGSEGLYELALTDISSHRQREDKLKIQAERDALTNLYNRRAAELRIERLLNESSGESDNQFALFMVDLDGFKPINDTYGHDVGDEVLKAISRRLRSSVRKEDLVVRWGGDEFVIFVNLGGYSSEGSRIAEKLLNTISAPIKITGNEPVKVGASIGISFYPNDATDLAQLLKYADDAMYTVKSQSKNSYQRSKRRDNVFKI